MSNPIILRAGTNDSDWCDLPEDLSKAIHELHAVHKTGVLHPKQQKAVRTLTDYVVRQHKEPITPSITPPET